MSASTPIFLSDSSEERWLKHITLNYTKNLKIPPCVFQVPQTMKETKPEAYIPQVVGLGPFHHFRPEVQQMESQKRDAVKSYIKRKEFTDFINFVNEMTVNELFEPTIRASYDRFLDLEGKTLSWIMVIDSIFLLHTVNNYVDQKEKKQVDPEIERLVRDILKLENQLPMKLLQQIRKALKRTFTEVTDIDLFYKFSRFCAENSPLKLSENEESMDRAWDLDKHILHYMYQLIMENCDHQKSETSMQESLEETVQGKPGNPPERNSANIRVLARKALSQVTDPFKQVKELITCDGREVVQEVGYSVTSAYEQAVSSGVKVPSNISKVANILQRLGQLNSGTSDQTSNPLRKIFVQEINLPSASQLHRIMKLKFARTEGGIKSVDINLDNGTVYLPVISLHANSEIVLRNLIAYEEASIKSGLSLKLREYVDLMCGIIDTENDVKLLKQEKIIEGDLSDHEIVSIFNGISMCTRKPGENSKVQRIVQEVNEKYSKLCIVKTYNFFEKFLPRLWRLIRRHFFPALVLIFLTLQYVCETGYCRDPRFSVIGWQPSPKDGSALSLDSYGNYLIIPRKMLRH